MQTQKPHPIVTNSSFSPYREKHSGGLQRLAVSAIAENGKLTFPARAPKTKKFANVATFLSKPNPDWVFQGKKSRKCGRVVDKVWSAWDKGGCMEGV